MNTITTPPNKPREQQFIQTGVSWESFKAIQQGFADSPGVRLFYYRGELEILSTSPLHEIVKGNIGFLVEDFMLEQGIDFVGTGSFSVEKGKRFFWGDRAGEAVKWRRCLIHPNLSSTSSKWYCWTSVL
jgi:hypothetical protein